MDGVTVMDDEHDANGRVSTGIRPEEESARLGGSCRSFRSDEATH